MHLVRTKDEKLLDFIPRVSTHLKAPYHLAPLAGIFDTAARGGHRVAVAVAVRHGKTTVAMHGIAKLLADDPSLEVMYLTHGANFSQRNNREIRRLFQEAGGQLSKDHSTIIEWRTEAGGGCFAASVDQPIVGRGANVIVVDDPIPSFEEVRKKVVRDLADEQIDFALTRLHKDGSMILISSPFHPDDPLGRRVHKRGWPEIRMPAVMDEGTENERALWPEVRPLDHLREVRAELRENDPRERTWLAQYMCTPPDDVDNGFGVPTRYTTIPDWPGFRDAIGLDMAFSHKKGADWTALVAMRCYGSTGYVREVLRLTGDLNLLEGAINEMRGRYGNCPIFSYVSGPEIGAVQYFATRGINIQGMPARFNKLVRAQATRDRWNAGRIMLPTEAPWLDRFLHNVRLFSGAESDPDDEVDALVSVSDGMLFANAARPATKAVGAWRY